MNDVSVIRVSRCGITRGTFYGKHVLTLIWVIMTGGSFKIVSNCAVLTLTPLLSDPDVAAGISDLQYGDRVKNLSRPGGGTGLSCGVPVSRARFECV